MVRSSLALCTQVLIGSYWLLVNSPLSYFTCDISVVAYICWILVYFYCFVHRVKLKIYNQNTPPQNAPFQHGNVKNFSGEGTACDVIGGGTVL